MADKAADRDDKVEGGDAREDKVEEDEEDEEDDKGDNEVSDDPMGEGGIRSGVRTGGHEREL